ncbi:MAG TPA: hypothetical protein VNH46_04410 [Gemmatimonadales bacterium]|nr:hypothetical protein [Gemmatimonadales bacterium]
MKRSALLFGALMLGAATAANAQGLSMQMSNGWTFSFAGNVNIFAQYQSQSSSGNTTGGPILVGAGKAQGFYYGTGLLPSFATFTASGKEGNTDLGVHFGFAPEVQCGGNNHDCFGTQFSGASIDMRQVFMTVGGSWGSILAGRELGVFQRQNILNDQTLFGVGGGGIAPRGTTLGRIGFGYIYPNFEPQFTYTSPAGRPGSISIGLFDPSNFGPYTTHNTPRVEAEGSYKSGDLLVFASATAQNSKTAPTGGTSKTAYGVAGGATYKTATFSVHGSGYYGRGTGTTLMFGPAGDDGTGNLTKSFGFYGQLTFTPTGSKATFAGSYGSSYLKASTGSAKTENSMVSGGIYYQATKSLKVVGEGDYMWSKNTPSGGATKNKAFTGAFGLMLFY